MGLAISQSSTDSLLACSRLGFTVLGIAIGLLVRVIINLLDNILVLFNSTTLFMLSPMALCAFFFYAWYESQGRSESNMRYQESRLRMNTTLFRGLSGV
jgi:hypothetical protein